MCCDFGHAIGSGGDFAVWIGSRIKIIKNLKRREKLPYFSPEQSTSPGWQSVTKQMPGKIII
jgi:hypothetical protein